MKTKSLLAVTLGAIVVSAALLLSFGSLLTADSVVGFLSVLTLVGVAAIEYRFNWKRLFGR